MTTQLILIDADTAGWKIPEATREIGRRGLADARSVLRAIPRRTFADDVDAPPRAAVTPAGNPLPPAVAA